MKKQAITAHCGLERACVERSLPQVGSGQQRFPGTGDFKSWSLGRKAGVTGNGAEVGLEDRAGCSRQGTAGANAQR